MSDCIGDFYILNGEVKPVSDFDDNILISDNMIYEVLRAEKGVPLFIGDYLLRLEKTHAMSGIPVKINPDEVKRLIKKLLAINHATDVPVKIMFSPDFTIAHLMKPYIPSPAEYVSGVMTILMNRERINPNVKFWRRNFRDEVSQELKKNKAFEAILVNAEGFVTEGSRSNIFFIKDNELYTPPGDTVLQGITRKKVLQVCQQLNFRVIETMIALKDLDHFTSAFLTGTSRKVLPVRQIGDFFFQCELPMLKKIAAGFDELVAKYIAENRL